LHEAGQDCSPNEIKELWKRVRDRYFDRLDSPGRRAIDAALGEIIRSHAALLDKVQVRTLSKRTVVGGKPGGTRSAFQLVVPKRPMP
jgi:hypothetical protein